MARITLYNILISCFVALGSGSYGYGFAVFPTSTGQPGFYSYFNLDRMYHLAMCRTRLTYFHVAESSYTAKYAFPHLCSREDHPNPTTAS
jgi:hypothetical protein